MFYKYAKSQTHNKLIQKEIHTMNIKYTPILRWKTDNNSDKSSFHHLPQ